MINLSYIKPGTLIRFNSNSKLKEKFWGHTPRFCPVNSSGAIVNDTPWKDRIQVAPESDTLLLYIEPLDYSKKTVATVAWAAAVAEWSWKRAKREFKTTKKISGGIFLTGDGKLIWISHLDIEHFEEVITSK